MKHKHDAKHFRLHPVPKIFFERKKKHNLKMKRSSMNAKQKLSDRVIVLMYSQFC